MTKATLMFTSLELDALAGACEETLEFLRAGRIWENEPPATRLALERATKKVLARCYERWEEEAHD